MQRFGTVIVFKPEVTKEQAAEALHKIIELIDETQWWPTPSGQPTLEECEARIEEYDDKHGGPAWYLP